MKKTRWKRMTRKVCKFINENNKKPKQKTLLKDKQILNMDYIAKMNNKEVNITIKSKQYQVLQHQFTALNKKISNKYAYSSKKD